MTWIDYSDVTVGWEPSHRMRWLVRDGLTAKLQQLWCCTDMRTEWRDVPLSEDKTTSKEYER